MIAFKNEADLSIYKVCPKKVDLKINNN